MSDGFRITSHSEGGTEIVGTLLGLAQLSSVLDLAVSHGKAILTDADTREIVLTIRRTHEWPA